MSGFLLVNPRSGDEEPSAEELLAAAHARGIRTHVLREGEDAAKLAAEEDRIGSRLRALLRRVVRGGHVRLRIDGEPVTARIVVVGNNVYRLHPLDLGTRPRIDGGVLHLGIACGLLPRSWEERRAPRIRIEADAPSLDVAIDGEPVRLRMPVELRVEPRALRLLVPAEAPLAAP